jgi:hypothetical protein
LRKLKKSGKRASLSGVNLPSLPSHHHTPSLILDQIVFFLEKRQEKVKAEAEAAETDPTGATTKEAGKEPHPPAKKFRMTESMKTIVWTLVGLSNEHCRLENEKQCVFLTFFQFL